MAFPLHLLSPYWYERKDINKWGALGEDSQNPKIH